MCCVFVYREFTFLHCPCSGFRIRANHQGRFSSTSCILGVHDKGFSSFWVTLTIPSTRSADVCCGDQEICLFFPCRFVQDMAAYIFVTGKHGVLFVAPESMELSNKQFGKLNEEFPAFKATRHCSSAAFPLSHAFFLHVPEGSWGILHVRCVVAF